MKSYFALIAVVFVCAGLAVGQEVKPSAELTLNYQFLHLSSEGSGTNVPLGGGSSISIPITSFLGFTADTSYATKSGTLATVSGITFGGGPQFTSRRNESVQPYFRFLVGAIDFRADLLGHTGSTTAFFWAPGGGIDLKVSRLVWIRTGADYMRAEKYGVGLNGIRVLGGVTFKFGGARAGMAKKEEAVKPAGGYWVATVPTAVPAQPAAAKPVSPPAAPPTVAPTAAIPTAAPQVKCLEVQIDQKGDFLCTKWETIQ